MTMKSLLALSILAAPVWSQTPVEKLLPGDALVFVEASGDPCRREAADLALAKIWHEPEVQEFARPLLAWSGMGLGALKMQLQGFGFGPETWEAFLGGRFTFSVYGLREYEWTSTYEMDGETHEYTSHAALPDLVFTFEYFQGEPGVVHDIVATAEGLLGSVDDLAHTQVEVAGQTVDRLADPKGEAPMEILYFVKNDRLFVSTSRELLAGILGRMAGEGKPSLASDPEFQAVRDKVRRPDTMLFLFSEVELLTRALAAVADDSDLDALAEIVPYRASGYGMELDAPGIRDRVVSLLVPDSPIAALAKSSGPLAHLGALPAETGAFCTLSVPPEKALDTLVAFLGGIDARAGERVQARLAEFRQQAGFDLRNDLLASIGPEMSLYVAWPGKSVTPDLGMAIQVRNREKLEAILQGFAQQVTGGMPRSLAYRDADIRFLELPGPRFDGNRGAMRPAWVFQGDTLLITPWPQAAKNWIAGRLDGTPRLEARPDYARLAENFRAGGMDPAAGCWVGYADLGALTGWVWDNAAPYVQSFAPAQREVQLDFAAWPRSEAVTQHLFGALSVTRVEGDMVYTEMYSPLGCLVPTTALVGFGLIAPGMMMARPAHYPTPMEEY